LKPPTKVFITGWWFQPLWKILVSWDYYSQSMGKKMFQTSNQIIFKNVRMWRQPHWIVTRFWMILNVSNEQCDDHAMRMVSRIKSWHNIGVQNGMLVCRKIALLIGKNVENDKAPPITPVGMRK
jgi:hypothetical protein